MDFDRSKMGLKQQDVGGFYAFWTMLDVSWDGRRFPFVQRDIRLVFQLDDYASLVDVEESNFAAVAGGIFEL